MPKRKRTPVEEYEVFVAEAIFPDGSTMLKVIETQQDADNFNRAHANRPVHFWKL